MNLVIDTNIVFSGILSPGGTISDLLLNSNEIFSFYAPTAIFDELGVHRQKLISLSGFTEYEIDFLIRTILKKINLIDLETVKTTTWKKAIELTKNIDEYDAPFIALSLELSAPLWTGDKKLAKGLMQQGIDWILDTKTIKQIRGDAD